MTSESTGIRALDCAEIADVSGADKVGDFAAGMGIGIALVALFVAASMID